MLVDVVGGKANTISRITKRCGVCGDPSCSDGNKLLQCCVCGVSVHQICVGGEVEGNENGFRCHCCKAGKSTGNQECELCPNVGGALAEVSGSNGRLWVHVMCVTWIPEVWFLDPRTPTVACGVLTPNKVMLDRTRLKCAVCGERNTGVCIQCGNPKCYTAFHVSCAFGSGVHMRYALGADGLVLLECSCSVHEPFAIADAPQCLEELNMKHVKEFRPGARYTLRMLNEAFAKKKKKASGLKKHAKKKSVGDDKAWRPTETKRQRTAFTNSVVTKPCRDARQMLDKINQTYFSSLETTTQAVDVLRKICIDEFDIPGTKFPNLKGCEEIEFVHSPYDKALTMAPHPSWVRNMEFVDHNKKDLRRIEGHRGTEIVGLLTWNLLKLKSDAKRQIVNVSHLSSTRDDLTAYLLCVLLRGLGKDVDYLVFFQIKARLRHYFSYAFDCNLVTQAHLSPEVVTMCLRLQDLDVITVLDRLQTTTLKLTLKRGPTGEYVPHERTASVLSSRSFETVPMSFTSWLKNTVNDEGPTRSIQGLENQLLACRRNNRDNVEALMRRVVAQTDRENELSNLSERAEMLAKQAGILNDAVSNSNAAKQDFINENAHCHYCARGDSSHGNLIVICDCCELGFHEKCHPTKIDLRASQWFCSKCSAGLLN